MVVTVILIVNKIIIIPLPRGFHRHMVVLVAAVVAVDAVIMTGVK
jgi:hypothetical protein